MGTPNPVRQAAHEAMRELWEICDAEVNENGEYPYPNNPDLKRYVTPGDATIVRWQGHFFRVEADFEKPTADGPVDETIRVYFPLDIRDLSECLVEIDWFKEDRGGTNTPPLKRFPEIAGLLTGVVRPSFIDAGS